MAVTLDDLPNEIIAIIFSYLSETDIISVGLVFSRLSRHDAIGDQIGNSINYSIFLHLKIYLT